MFRSAAHVFSAAIALLLAGCGSSASGQVTASLGANALQTIRPPAYIPGPLNGQSTARRIALRRPLGVIIENLSPDSRPQSGLSAASIVFETLAEGGVTRFLAIYLENDAARVGPVRSTRVYFNHWAGALHAILAHVGGNDDAQQELRRSTAVFNIDENRWEKSLYDTGTPLFSRSRDRIAPHNMYVNTYKLRSYALATKQNWAYAQAFFSHTAPAPPARRGRSASIDISFANPLGGQITPDYAVHYQFDRPRDRYLRAMGGAPHVDVLTHRQIEPANVVLMMTDQGIFDPLAGPTPESILLRDTGRGVAWYFIDGRVARGNWLQPNATAPLKFLDARGHAVRFNVGQTWIELVPKGSPVSWTTR